MGSKAAYNSFNRFNYCRFPTPNVEPERKTINSEDQGLGIARCSRCRWCAGCCIFKSPAIALGLPGHLLWSSWQFITQATPSIPLAGQTCLPPTWRLMAKENSKLQRSHGGHSIKEDYLLDWMFIPCDCRSLCWRMTCLLLRRWSAVLQDKAVHRPCWASAAGGEFQVYSQRPKAFPAKLHLDSEGGR